MTWLREVEPLQVANVASEVEAANTKRRYAPSLQAGS